MQRTFPEKKMKIWLFYCFKLMKMEYVSSFRLSKKFQDWFIVGAEVTGIEVLLNITIIHDWKKMWETC